MSKKSRSKFLCLNCGIDTGKIREHYFIHTKTWLSVVGSKQGMLCVNCLEKRLNRQLNMEDFPKVTINDPKICDMSVRLRSRVSNET